MRHFRLSAAGLSVSVLVSLLALASCGDSPAQEGVREGGAARGLAAFMSQGCITCHHSGTIQGPYLEGIGDVYLKEAGGALARAKSMVKAYVKDPRGVKPIVPRSNPSFTQMPSYPLMDESTLDVIAEYVLSIRDGRKP